MAAFPTLTVMISSRCNDTISFGGKAATLSDVRRAAKASLEGVRVFGRPLFSVWINEDAVLAADGSATEQCLAQVRDADLVIALCNGNAGWATTGGGIGICHAELETAVNQTGSKVFLVALPEPTDAASASERDLDFRAYVARINRWRRTATDGESAIAAIEEAAMQGYAEMARRGARYAARGAYASGDALDWSRLNYEARAARMIEVLNAYLAQLDGARRRGLSVAVPLGGADAVLFAPHAIPDTLTVAAAREMVGQPFVTDHERIGDDPTAAGPIHLIACNKGATIAQARRLLGIDDATYVETEFGVYVADEVMKTQVFLLADCRDASSAKQAVQAFFDWLAGSGELAIIVERARRRAMIARAVREANTESGRA